jgi:hypothetical protein
VLKELLAKKDRKVRKDKLVLKEILEIKDKKVKYPYPRLLSLCMLI